MYAKPVSRTLLRVRWAPLQEISVGSDKTKKTTTTTDRVRLYLILLSLIALVYIAECELRSRECSKRGRFNFPTVLYRSNIRLMRLDVAYLNIRYLPAACPSKMTGSRLFFSYQIFFGKALSDILIFCKRSSVLSEP